MLGLALMKVLIISMMIDVKGQDDNRKIIYDVDGPIHAEVGASVIIGCSFIYEGFTPEFITWYKCDESQVVCRWPSDMIFHSGNGNSGEGEFKGRVFLLEPDVTQQNASFVIRNLRPSDTGSYQLIVEGSKNGGPWWTSFKLKKPITATGLRQPRIAGETTVQEFGSLNLTCDADSNPPSVVTWAKVGWTEATDTILVTGTQRANLVIPMATRDHSGRYSCTAQHLTSHFKTLTSLADVSVIEKYPVPEKLFSTPGVITSSTISMALTAGLALFCACLYCLAKIFRRCPEKTCRNQVVRVRTDGRIVEVTQQTGGVCGVDGPEDGALEGVESRE